MRLLREPLWRWLWLALLAAASLVTFDPKLYINGDNVDYMRLAEAARAGQIWASPKYPPLFPWLLVPVQAAFGLALIPQKILVTLFHLGSGILLAGRARRSLPHPWGEPVAWIAMTSVPVLEFAHYVMSEIPYLFFSLLAIEAAERWALRGGGRLAAAAAVAGACTFYTRSVGAALWFAIACWMLPQRRVGRGVFVIAAAACALPWCGRALLGPPNPYFRQLVQVNPFYPEFGLLDAAGWGARVAENARIYLLGEIPTLLFPIVFRSTYDAPELRYAYLPWVLGLLPMAMLAVGLGRSVRRKDLAAFYVLLYLIPTLLWPRVWAGIRFLVPILPFLVVFLLEALLWIFGIVRGRLSGRPRLALVVLLAYGLLAAFNAGLLARQAARYPPEWDAYFRAAHWIRDHAPAGEIVLDRKPAMLTFVSGHPAVAFPRESDPDRLLAWMEQRGVALIVVPSLPYDDIQRILIPAIQARQARFEPLYEIDEPYTVVLRLRRSPTG